MNDAIVLREGARGCGFRQAGGLYMIGGGDTRPCGRFPLELEKCATCGGGVRQKRGWTWIEPAKLWPLTQEQIVSGAACHTGECYRCPVGGAVPERAGLIWIGKQHYPTPMHFLAEGKELGFSRRIEAVPKGFVPHETWVFLAHPAAIVAACIDEETGGASTEEIPGAFAVWRPAGLQKVVTRETPQEEVDEIREKGIEPVVVDPVTEELH